MSRLSRKPIIISSETAVELTENVLNFKGKQGTFSLKVLPYIKTELKNDQLTFTAGSKIKQAQANLGTMTVLAKNALTGISEGFSRTLQLVGVGYRAALEGKSLILQVGFSHPVKFEPPEGITLAVEKNNVIKVSGIDKALVGETAAQIRRIKKPEPYKGKGIRYENEEVRIKSGKKAGGAAESTA